MVSSESFPYGHDIPLCPALSPHWRDVFWLGRDGCEGAAKRGPSARHGRGRGARRRGLGLLGVGVGVGGGLRRFGGPRPVRVLRHSCAGLGAWRRRQGRASTAAAAANEEEEEEDDDDNEERKRANTAAVVSNEDDEDDDNNDGNDNGERVL